MYSGLPIITVRAQTGVVDGVTGAVHDLETYLMDLVTTCRRPPMPHDATSGGTCSGAPQPIIELESHPLGQISRQTPLLHRFGLTAMARSPKRRPRIDAQIELGLQTSGLECLVRADPPQPTVTTGRTRRITRG